MRWDEITIDYSSPAEGKFPISTSRKAARMERCGRKLVAKGPILPAQHGRKAESCRVAVAALPLTG